MNVESEHAYFPSQGSADPLTQCDITIHMLTVTPQLLIDIKLQNLWHYLWHGNDFWRIIVRPVNPKVSIIHVLAQDRFCRRRQRARVQTQAISKLINWSAEWDRPWARFLECTESLLHHWASATTCCYRVNASKVSTSPGTWILSFQPLGSGQATFVTGPAAAA